MQSHDWNDLKYLLALARTGRLRAAGRAVGVSDTTVARRIKALEAAVGVPLFVRGMSGHYAPTDAARDILVHAEAIELENTLLRETLGQAAERVTGSVRISAVPIVVNRILVPALPALSDKHPQLAVELVPAAQNLDLSKREADLALRFARPETGGLRTKAQRLGSLTFGVYAARSGDRRAWITYDDAHADLPQARWLDRMARAEDAQAPLRVADAETALEAVAAGLGRTLLPKRIADADQRLRRVPADAPLPARDIWLLSHADHMARGSVAAAKAWLIDLDWDA
ncbi:MAG: LysR family transcriptional regulator [Pseudomonadota bacterium]